MNLTQSLNIPAPQSQSQGPQFPVYTMGGRRKTQRKKLRGRRRFTRRA